MTLELFTRNRISRNCDVSEAYQIVVEESSQELALDLECNCNIIPLSFMGPMNKTL